MALPKEPRQKMINIMYLVLTALLALNVSAEILNAFRTVNNSLQNATTTIETKNQSLLKSLNDLANDPRTKERADIWKPRAVKAQQLATDMNNYLESIKAELMKASGYNPPKDTTFKEDDLESTTRLMTDPGTQGKELLQKLTEYKNSLLAIDNSIRLNFANSLPIDLSIPRTKNQEHKNDWAASYFYMTPTIAALTILSKFQNDVKNSEAMVVEYCHQQVGAVKYIFNQYEPLVGQSSNYLMPGQPLTITAGIGAYNTESKPSINIDGSSVPLNANGVGEYKTTVGGPGNYTKKVHISYFNQATGTQESKDIDVLYAVGSPTGANVSADALKVLYIGLDNPLSVSGGNVGDEKVTASIDNGTMTKVGAGKYIVRPGKAGNANITVTADGHPTPFLFHVKDVPDPIAEIGTNKGGRMKVNDFKAQFGVRAVLENFIYENVKFTVTGYTIVLNGAGFSQLKFRDVTGDSFDPVRDLIEQAKPGTTVSIDLIKASGPGGSRQLPPIVFNLY